MHRKQEACTGVARREPRVTFACRLFRLPSTVTRLPFLPAVSTVSRIPPNHPLSLVDGYWNLDARSGTRALSLDAMRERLGAREALSRYTDTDRLVRV